MGKTIPFAIFLIVLGSSCIACSCIPLNTGNTERNFDNVELIGEGLTTRNSTNLTDFIYTLSNYEESEFNSKKQVDCLGLGKTVATALEWFFAGTSNGTVSVKVEFSLSSRKQQQRVYVETGRQFGLEWTDFRIERRTVLIVHGFLSHGQESWIRDMEKAFLRWDDVNVVIVDWSAGGNTWNYYKAAVNTRLVGREIAKFLEHVENATANFGEARGPLHFVGHSLGAHICGFTAKELARRGSKWTLERITGLDPAQPCFRSADAMLKLYKSDAPFVDIIHTNGKFLSELGLGLPEPIGHVDFYPNGGRSQPGCARANSSYYKYLPIPVQWIERTVCSHGRSYVYLTESLISATVNNCTFWAQHWDMTYRSLRQINGKPCDAQVCNEMGINAINYPHRGTFFVATSNDIPFCLNSTRVIEEVKIQLEKDLADELED